MPGALVIRRIGASVLTLFLASLIIFAILRFVPGDPATVLAGADASDATIASIRSELGLDQSLVAQYLHWLRRVLTLDLGRSYVVGGTISELLINGFANTAALSLTALVLAIVIAAVLALSSSLWPRSWLLSLVSAFNSLSIAVPTFVTGVVLVQLFAVTVAILPAGGTPPNGYFADPGISVQYLVLPALCLALPVASTLTRFLSESLRTELAQPYILTARALGISRQRVVLQSALRNALPTTLTVLGIQTGQLLGSAILVEAIFAWPGLGQLLAQGINARDYPLVQILLLFSVAIFIVITTLTDLAASALVPTQRLGDRG